MSTTWKIDRGMVRGIIYEIQSHSFTDGYNIYFQRHNSDTEIENCDFKSYDDDWISNFKKALMQKLWLVSDNYYIVYIFLLSNVPLYDKLLSLKQS